MIIRRATGEDLAAIVALLADDVLGVHRESPEDLDPYRRAFALIESDPGQFLAVAERDGEIVGTLQFTLLPGLSRRGALRAQIEAVRVRSAERGSGLGAQLVQWAIQRARTLGCTTLQLTSDKSRTDAHRFYLRLGFADTHEGFKITL